MKNSVLDYLIRIRLPITIFVALSAFALTFFLSRTERDGIGYTLDQPIAYSHKL